MRIIEVADSPDVPDAFRYVVIVSGLNIGPVQEDTLEIDVANTLTKAQTKSAINSAIIALFAGKGFTVTATRILTVADLAG